MNDSKNLKIQITDFEILINQKGSNVHGELGWGSYGKVLLAKFKINKNLYALKIISKNLI